jgi:excisionase family DNA binding protein
MTMSFSPPNDPLLCSVGEACRMLGLGRTKVYELIKQGKLDTVRVGRRRLIVVESIHNYLNELRRLQSHSEIDPDLVGDPDKSGK